MGNLLPTVPIPDMGFWMPGIAISACTAVMAGGSYLMVAKPADALEKCGYSNATGGATWALLVAAMRHMASFLITFAGIFLYFLVQGFKTGHFSLYHILFCLLIVGMVSLSSAYRAYLESPNSKDNSDTSVAASKKNLMLFGTLSGLLVLAIYFQWLWSGSTNYVTDDYHGLPDELTFVKKSAARFLKQHVLGNS